MPGQLGLVDSMATQVQGKLRRFPYIFSDSPFQFHPIILGFIKVTNLASAPFPFTLFRSSAVP